MRRKRFMVCIDCGKADFPALIIFCAMFIAGSIIGVIAAGYITSYSYSGDALALLGFASGDGGSGVFLRFLSDSKYHIISFLLGFTLFGTVVVPIVFGIRGFFLAFCVSTAARCLGGSFPLAVLLAYLPAALISLPCLFVISLRSFDASRQLNGSIFLRRSSLAPKVYDKSYFTVCMLCILIMLLLSIFDLHILPRIITALFPALFI